MHAITKTNKEPPQKLEGTYNNKLTTADPLPGITMPPWS